MISGTSNSPPSKTKKRRVRLVATEREVDKIWAALTFISRTKADKAGLGDVHCWVSVDELGDFLKRRQVDASSVSFKEDDPNTRYALVPTAVKKEHWDDPTIVKGLILCVDRGFVTHLNLEGLNHFAPVPAADHDLWELYDVSVPFLNSWKGEIR